MFNPFKKKEAEVSEKVKARKEKQEERRRESPSKRTQANKVDAVLRVIDSLWYFYQCLY